MWATSVQSLSAWDGLWTVPGRRRVGVSTIQIVATQKNLPWLLSVRVGADDPFGGARWTRATWTKNFSGPNPFTVKLVILQYLPLNKQRIPFHPI